METLTRSTSSAINTTQQTLPVLPIFPDFTPLQLRHRVIVERFTRHFAPYADFTFTSLYSWNTRGIVALSTLHENLVVRFSDDVTDASFLSFLGTNKLDETIPVLLDYSQAHHLGPVLCLVPQQVIAAMPDSLRNAYLIGEDRNNHDYILSVRNLAEFSDAQFGQRTANYKKFNQRYGARAHSGLIDIHSPAVRKEVEALLHHWRQVRQRDSRETRNEFFAIQRCLTRSQALGVKAFGTYIDGKIVAINLFEIQRRMAIGHFFKADTTYRGISEHLVHTFARYLQTQGVTHLNIQQDLGIEGLRAYKLSYNPVYFLKKFTIAKA